MNTHHLLDAELAAALDQWPISEALSKETLQTYRAFSAQAAEQYKARPCHSHINVSEHFTGDGVRMLVYQHESKGQPRAALLWIHGGGYVCGNPEGDDDLVMRLAEEVGCAIVSVDYRLAPEHPHPAPVHDCYAALRWLREHARTFGVDEARIGIAGRSAGGGLCAALALLARDRAEVAICLQALLQPMLDDRHAADTYSHPIAGEFVWTKQSNHYGWMALLGHEPGKDGVSPYASAARAEDLSGLPPTYIAVGTLDLFIEENLEYARRLLRAGVATEVHAYPGACHAFEFIVPDAQVSLAFHRDLVNALRKGLA